VDETEPARSNPWAWPDFWSLPSPWPSSCLRDAGPGAATRRPFSKWRTSSSTLRSGGGLSFAAVAAMGLGFAAVAAAGLGFAAGGGGPQEAGLAAGLAAEKSFSAAGGGPQDILL